MSLIVAMAVYEEADLLPAALASISETANGQVDRVCVFDGAWRGGKDGSHRFGPTPGSADSTRDVAFRWATAQRIPLWWYGAGNPLCDPDGYWPSQEEKRTALFQEVRAEPGDWVFVMDADETLHGGWPEVFTLTDPLAPPCAHHVMVRCVGGNDLPGIRGEWPNGDYSADYKPEIRLFPWTPDLECLYPGGYWQDGQMIEAYSDAAGTPALPVIDGLTMDHHGAARSPDRIAAKIAYYHEEHPERSRWQRALHR